MKGETSPGVGRAAGKHEHRSCLAMRAKNGASLASLIWLPTSSTTVSSWETSLSISWLLALKSSDHGSAGSGKTGNKGVFEEEERDEVCCNREGAVRPRARRGC